MAGTNWAALAAKAAEAPNAGNFEPLPPGKYQVKVEAAEHKTTTTNKDMFVLTLVVTQGQHEGRKLWQNIVISPENATALSIAFRHFAALGADANFFATEPDHATICARVLDKTATATVKLRKDDPSRNDVGDLSPAAGGDPLAPTPPAAAAAPTAPAPAAPAAPPQDPFAVG